MKKLFLILILCNIVSVSFSQDIIIKKDGNELTVKVIEIGILLIEYKNHDHLDGPTYIISKADVFMIRYENGKKDVFVENVENKKPTITGITNQANFEKGMRDARLFYYGDNIKWGKAFLMTIITTPIGGGRTAKQISDAEPVFDKKTLHDKELRYNKDYINGYTKEAKQQNKRKAWGGFFVGIIVFDVAIAGAILVVSSVGL